MVHENEWTPARSTYHIALVQVVYVLQFPVLFIVQRPRTANMRGSRFASDPNHRVQIQLFFTTNSIVLVRRNRSRKRMERVFFGGEARSVGKVQRRNRRLLWSGERCLWMYALDHLELILMAYCMAKSPYHRSVQDRYS